MLCVFRSSLVLTVIEACLCGVFSGGWVLQEGIGTVDQ